MTKINPLLIDIVYRLLRTEPNWESIVLRFKDITSRRSLGLEKDQSSLYSLMSELVLHDALTQVAQGLTGRMVVDPITPNSHSENYHFYLSARGTLEIKDKRSNYIKGELDGLILADDLPVIFDVKLSRTYAAPGVFLLSEEQNHKAIQEPVKEFFNVADIGIVSIGFIIERERERHPVLEPAATAGEIALGLYPSKGDFLKKVTELSTANGLIKANRLKRARVVSPATMKKFTLEQVAQDWNKTKDKILEGVPTYPQFKKCYITSSEIPGGVWGY